MEEKFYGKYNGIDIYYIMNKDRKLVGYKIDGHGKVYDILSDAFKDIDKFVVGAKNE